MELSPSVKKTYLNFLPVVILLIMWQFWRENESRPVQTLPFLAEYPLPSGLQNAMPEASPWHVSCLTAKC